jgi:hypothetical protein
MFPIPISKKEVGPPEKIIQSQTSEYLKHLKTKTHKSWKTRKPSPYKRRKLMLNKLRELIKVKWKAPSSVFQRAVAIFDRYCFLTKCETLYKQYRLYEVVAVISVKFTDSHVPWNFNLSNIQRNDLKRLKKQEISILNTLQFCVNEDPTPIEYFTAMYEKEPSEKQENYMENAMIQTSLWLPEQSAKLSSDLL